MRLTTRHIAELVALQTGVPVADLVSHTGRCRVPSYARHLAWWAARRSDSRRAYCDGRRSYPMISAALGGYDHSTAITGVRQVDRRIAASVWWRDAAARLMATISGLERDDPAALTLLAVARHPPPAAMLRALAAFHVACGMRHAMRPPPEPRLRDDLGRFLPRNLCAEPALWRGRRKMVASPVFR
jgi:hypothetical protein